jgi:hypothetical protein
LREEFKDYKQNKQPQGLKKKCYNKTKQQSHNSSSANSNKAKRNQQGSRKHQKEGSKLAPHQLTMQSKGLQFHS